MVIFHSYVQSPEGKSPAQGRQWQQSNPSRFTEVSKGNSQICRCCWSADPSDLGWWPLRRKGNLWPYGFWAMRILRYPMLKSLCIQLVAEFGGGNLQDRGSLCSCCSCMGHIHFVYCTLQPPQLRKVAVVPELNFGGFINCNNHSAQKAAMLKDF